MMDKLSLSILKWLAGLSGVYQSDSGVKLSHVENYLNCPFFCAVFEAEVANQSANIQFNTKGSCSKIISCLGGEDRIIFCVHPTPPADKTH